MEEPIKDDWDKWMDAYQNRRIYTDFSLEDLVALPDNLILFAIDDFVIEKMASEDLTEVYAKFKKLPQPHQFIFAVRTLSSEVGNGGFDQFFFNSSSFFVREAYAGLQQLKASAFADIVKRAMTLVYKDLRFLPEMNADDLQVSIENTEIRASLNKLDEEFHENSDQLDSLMISFVRQHITEFVTI